ncbi:Rad52/Rad22 family DNA repair protein [Herpetosiphon llansteffanensis]|uniref:Rad52/Rad22 family DNA repair protein n=1 Tax=Herpetosiphon llansteffanensis TaxID=2094568 RepID=UPI000D7BA213|nr:Rad52/Rad22 family DNA repair protein [Herpetosiphon llansteffanensis]
MTQPFTTIKPKLETPFPMDIIEIKPTVVTKDKTRALAIAYAEVRAYQDRLDAVVGGEWSVTYRPLGTGAVICQLNIMGITREDVGEAEQTDPNKATVAVAQAFKRACSAFGLGRYLYSMPKVWAEYDQEKKCFVYPERIIAHMYKQVGIKE